MLRQSTRDSQQLWIAEQGFELTDRAVHRARGYELTCGIESSCKDFSRVPCKLHHRRLQRTSTCSLHRLSAPSTQRPHLIETQFRRTACMRAPFCPAPFTTATALLPRFASAFARLTSWLVPKESVAGRFSADMMSALGVLCKCARSRQLRLESQARVCGSSGKLSSGGRSTAPSYISPIILAYTTPPFHLRPPSAEP